MTKFNSYAKRLDTLAKASFKEYLDSEAAYKKAEEKMREYPPRHGMVDAVYAAKSARAKADYVEAQAAYLKAKRAFEDSTRQFDDLRNDLVAAVNDAFSADPRQLDGNVLELLKSGILNSNEYTKLLNEAKAAYNPTMVRMIGKYADEASRVMADKNGQNDPEAAALRSIVHESNLYTGVDRLEGFDTMVSVYGRCTKNPAMISKWDFLLGETIEKF